MYKNKLIIKVKNDYIFELNWIFKIIVKLMRHGLRFLSEKLIYNFFKINKNEKKLNTLLLLFEVLENIRIAIIFVQISRNIKVPLVLSFLEQYNLAIHWLFISFGQRAERHFNSKFILELQSIIYNKSHALVYKKEIENKLYEHFINLLE